MRRTIDTFPHRLLKVRQAIARDFQNLTFNELENVRPLEGQITGRVIDLDQYSTILAEFDVRAPPVWRMFPDRTQLGILERSFLNELTRKKSLFRQAKEAIRKGIKQQLEVLEVGLLCRDSVVMLTLAADIRQDFQDIWAQDHHRA